MLKSKLTTKIKIIFFQQNCITKNSSKFANILKKKTNYLTKILSLIIF